MASSEVKQYPRGQISLGAGELRQCTDFEWTFSNGAKLVHTLRANPSGIVTGNKQVTFSGKTVVDEDGLERDYFDLVETGKAVQARIRLPGATTKTIEGAVNEVKGRLTLEDGVQIDFAGIGKFSKS